MFNVSERVSVQDDSGLDKEGELLKDFEEMRELEGLLRKYALTKVPEGDREVLYKKSEEGRRVCSRIEEIQESHKNDPIFKKHIAEQEEEIEADKERAKKFVLKEFGIKDPSRISEHREILGVSENADLEDIKRAYHKLAHKYHPDQNPQEGPEGEKFKKVRDAYSVLKKIKK